VLHAHADGATPQEETRRAQPLVGRSAACPAGQLVDIVEDARVHQRRTVWRHLPQRGADGCDATKAAPIGIAVAVQRDGHVEATHQVDNWHRLTPPPTTDDQRLNPILLQTPDGSFALCQAGDGGE